MPAFSTPHYLRGKLLPRRIAIIENNSFFIEQLERISKRLGIDGTLYLHRTGAEVIEAMKDPHWRIDLVLVDLGLPDVNGIDIILALRKRFPQVLILVVSVMTSEHAVISAIRAGACGYVLKGDDEENLATAIRSVLHGEYPISPALARCLFRLAGAPQVAAVGLGVKLSPRELETLRHLSCGHTYEGVASLMGVSLSTIRTNIQKIYRKLNAHSQVQAISKARNEGLI